MMDWVSIALREYKELHALLANTPASASLKAAGGAVGTHGCGGALPGSTGCRKLRQTRASVWESRFTRRWNGSIFLPRTVWRTSPGKSQCAIALVRDASAAGGDDAEAACLRNCCSRREPPLAATEEFSASFLSCARWIPRRSRKGKSTSFSKAKRDGCWWITRRTGCRKKAKILKRFSQQIRCTNARLCRCAAHPLHRCRSSLPASRPHGDGSQNGSAPGLITIGAWLYCPSSGGTV